MSNRDDFLDLFRLTQALPHLVYVEQYSLFRMAGNLENKHVLDLGCNDGSITRSALERNAASAVGLDASEKSIEVAKLASGDRANLEFKVYDPEALPKVGSFDVALGVHVLHHAKSKESLLALAKAIYNNLKPGGKFVAINDNPGNAPECYKKYKKYGFVKTGPKEKQEGDTIRYSFFDKNGKSYELDYTYLKLETYEEIFLEAGFQSFEWKILKVSEQSKKEYNLDFWRIFLNHPPVIGIEAVK